MIFYLSCTGNTLWAAKEIHNATGEELINMADSANRHFRMSLKPSERLGFCFPVHGWRPPILVRKFIQDMEIITQPNTFCYAVCTAGDTAGETVDILKHDLADVGITLHSAYSLLMPNTYVGLPFMDVDQTEVQKHKKEQAAKDIKRYMVDILDRREGVFNITRGRWPRINSRLLGGFFLKYLIKDEPFHVDENKCIKCGRCAAACPTGNILHNSTAFPEWKHNGTCMTCFACYHNCPLHCIGYGSRTKHKGQYFFGKK